MKARTMVDWAGLFATAGMLAISLALVVMGLLSRRLGKVTRERAYYIGFFIASALVAVGAVARLANLTMDVAATSALHQNILWVILYNGIPAVGVTLGVIVAWRYWSWLLAERGG